jgi:ribosomal protein S17E
MGKIKSKQIKKVANFFIEKKVEFGESFEKNKKLVNNSMPSKKLKNQLAGLLSKKARQIKEKAIELSPKKE